MGTRSWGDFYGGAFLCAHHHVEIRDKDKVVDDGDDDYGLQELLLLPVP